MKGLANEPAGTLAIRDARAQVVTDSVALVTSSDALATSMRQARRESRLAVDAKKYIEEKSRAELEED